MQETGDNPQDPRPGENDDETVDADRRKGGASHKPVVKFTPGTTDDPDPDGPTAEPYPKVGPPPLA
jgi:hypothetical protein